MVGPVRKLLLSAGHFNFFCRFPAVLSFSHAFLLVRVLRIGLRVVRGSGILLQAVASGVELGTLPVGAVPSPVLRWQNQNMI